MKVSPQNHHHTWQEAHWWYRSGWRLLGSACLEGFQTTDILVWWQKHLYLCWNCVSSETTENHSLDWCEDLWTKGTEKPQRQDKNMDTCSNEHRMIEPLLLYLLPTIQNCSWSQVRGNGTSFQRSDDKLGILDRCCNIKRLQSLKLLTNVPLRTVNIYLSWHIS